MGVQYDDLLDDVLPNPPIKTSMGVQCDDLVEEKSNPPMKANVAINHMYECGSDFVMVLIKWLIMGVKFWGSWLGLMWMYDNDLWEWMERTSCWIMK